MPTEAEWEKAARGGRQGKYFPWGGNTVQHTRANYFASTNLCSYDTSETDGYHPMYNDGVLPYTSPVGSFSANGYGLHDMAGNVMEWCWDWADDLYQTYQIDPHGPVSGVARMQRGGSWGSDDAGAYALQCWVRSYVGQFGDSLPPTYQTNSVGFRCVRGQ